MWRALRGQVLVHSPQRIHSAERVVWAGCISEICCMADDKLYPNIYVSNARDFDRWCEMSLMAIKAVCDLHDHEWDNHFVLSKPV